MVIPCRKALIRKVGGHVALCVRCFVVYVVTLILAPLTYIVGQTGRHIWIDFYRSVVTQYSPLAYAALTLTLLLLLPIHGTYTILSRKESNVLRAVTSVLFSLSLYLVYAYLAVNVFPLPKP